MRVIAGEKRSIPLLSVPGKDTRPTTDRIKETLFNIISADVPGSNFLDLYAGSGQIGIEALSRGAKFCVFVENDRNAASVIEKNLKKTNLEDSSRLINRDAEAALSGLRLQNGVFDIVFIDPPYALHREKELLQRLKDEALIDENSVVIIEADMKRDANEIIAEGFELTRDKSYKTNRHLFLRLTT
ncbi:MAG: 16S rRNA (guanine(966)-N(2))-methyltransferase RsmD [Lachnospiraceae bacterium]|nr:16S rRNA (guanine(966)-N(2))-methyltransferase RsmD [Lachnospiraceae bacterium]